MIYLKYNEDNHHKVIGVINNRTWNWFSSADSPLCPSLLDLVPDESDKNAIMPLTYQIQLDLGFDEEKLKLHNMQDDKRYRIQYFDPANTSIINEELVTSHLGVLPLVNYPLLTAARPLVFFKLFRDPLGDNTDAFMPEIADEWPSGERANTAFTVSIHVSKINFSTDKKRQVIPNPATEFIRISPSPDPQNNILIYDIMGTMVLAIQNNAGNIDITNLSSGMYYIKIKNEPYVLPFEKIHR